MAGHCLNDDLSTMNGQNYWDRDLLYISQLNHFQSPNNKHYQDLLTLSGLSILKTMIKFSIYEIYDSNVHAIVWYSLIENLVPILRTNKDRFLSREDGRYPIVQDSATLFPSLLYKSYSKIRDHEKALF